MIYMDRSTRLAGALLVAAITFTTVMPATAAPQAVAQAEVVKVQPDKPAHGKVGAQAQRQVLRDLARLDAQLLRVGREARTAGLSDAVRPAVLENIADDRLALADLAAEVRAGTVDPREVRATLRSVRPMSYQQVVNSLRLAARLAASAAEARAALEGDLGAPWAELDAAEAGLASAVEKALLVTAFSDRAARQAVRQELAAAAAALTVVLDYVAGLPEEPVEPPVA